MYPNIISGWTLSRSEGNIGYRTSDIEYRKGKRYKIIKEPATINQQP
jgi:hypothetical protein